VAVDKAHGYRNAFAQRDSPWFDKSNRAEITTKTLNNGKLKERYLLVLTFATIR
jgi:hypothetical protein